MINSLSKDSHITQSTCHPKLHPSERSAYTSVKSSVPLNNSDIFVNKKPADISFSGFFNAKDANRPAKVYTSKMVKNFLEMAADKPSLFNAAFSIGLTCILRPAAIMALPADKKNADDKKYAAAHSIASGIIGYIIALAIFSPISAAVKKIAANPENYASFTKKGLKYLKDDKAIDATKKYMSMLPDTILAAPRAIVTVALIPPILKYVFGWEKKNNHKETKPVAQVAPKSPAASNKIASQKVKGGVN